MTSAAAGWQRNQAYLDSFRKTTTESIKSQKRKALESEIDELKAKRRRVEASRDSLISGANSYAEEAEEKGKVALIVQSIALRRSANDKSEQLKGIETELGKKEEALKAI